MAHLLIDKGANVNMRDKRGQTALHVARSADLAQNMLAHGGDINAKNNDGHTPLWMAVHYHRKDVIELLRKKGAKEE